MQKPASLVITVNKQLSSLMLIYKWRVCGSHIPRRGSLQIEQKEQENMAKASNKMVMFFNLVLLLSLLLIMSMAEARLFGGKCAITYAVYIKSSDWSLSILVLYIHLVWH